MEIKTIKIKDADYPPLLREITNPSVKIYIRGTLPPFNLSHIAIVGTRKATRDGIELARKVAKSLAEHSFVIVSGLAMGIDTAAHEGALSGDSQTACGEFGRTIAVLGNGIDTIYPAQNENLARKILDNHGAIISEYEPGTPALPHQFLERNRIVAGLCVATIVIEAPKKSGAIATARLAAEAGREVFVFPGSSGHPQYAGSHALIRDGARLVNSVDDILEDLSGIAPASNQGKNLFSEMPANLDQKRHKEKNLKKAVILPNVPQEFYAVLSKSKNPLPLDKIAECTKLTAQEVNQIIGELVIYGIVLETPAGYRLKD